MEKVIKEQNLNMVVNNTEVKDNLKKHYLNPYKDLEPLLKNSETIVFDKPKSKFHK